MDVARRLGGIPGEPSIHPPVIQWYGTEPANNLNVVWVMNE
ncbi:hypothetical protein RSAG8_08207, partial [Rhizoctonia solani AG-8 WAC10335]